jgi:hypothetical protein
MSAFNIFEGAAEIQAQVIPTQTSRPAIDKCCSSNVLSKLSLPFNENE